MLVAAARSYFLPRTVLTPRSAKRAEDSSMAQLATAATLLGGCSSTKGGRRVDVPSWIKGVRPSRICGDPRRFSQLFACRFRRGTPAAHSFAGILLGRRRTFPDVKKPCQAAGRKTADVDHSYIFLQICFIFEKRTHALFRLPATPLTATARGAARGALASGYNTGRPRAAT